MDSVPVLPLSRSWDQMPIGLNAKRPRNRFVPYKILSYALFARLECISRYSAGLDTYVVLRMGQFGRKVNMQREAARDHLRWLEDTGYIRELQFERGRASFIVRHPNTYNWSDEPPEVPSA